MGGTKRIEKNSKLVQNRRQDIKHNIKQKQKQIQKQPKSIQRESVPERERERENGVLGDHVGDCVFLGAQANLQARSQDSAQGC